MMPARNLKTIARNLWKNKVFTAINIGGLAIGLAVAVLILWWVKSELSYNSYHPGAEQIYRIKTHLSKSKWVWEATPLPLSEVVAKEVPEISKVAIMSSSWTSPALNINGKVFIEKTGAYINKNWFNVFHYDFVRGNAQNFFRNPFSLLLTESKAKQYFGNGDPIGQIIRIDTINYQVQAVVKDNPANSSFQYDILIPIDAYLSDPARRKNDMQWNNFNYITFVQLQENADAKKVSAKLQQVMRRYKKDDDISLSLTSLQDLYFENDLTSSSFLPAGNRKTVYIFSIMAVVLLLIACINYVNLTTAKASLRAKEVSIKKIVGANRWSLFWQFLLESFVVSVIAVMLSIALIFLLLPFFNKLTERHFVFSLLSGNMWPVLLTTLLAATVLNGVYPAILLSSFQPLKVFRGVTILKMKDASLRRSLVVLQFTLAIILITGTVVISKQLKFIQERDMGYDRSQVFSFYVPYKLWASYDEKAREVFFSSFKHELEINESIESVSLASNSIVNLNSSNSGTADWDGHDKNYTPTVFQLSADENFMTTMGLKLADGRWFEANNKADLHNFIINETAAREFGINKPVIGQRFSFQGDTGQIIGVVKDFNFKSMHSKIGPLAILNNPSWRSQFFVKTKPAGTRTALAAAEKVWQRFAGDKPFDYSFLDDRFNMLYKAEQKISTLIYWFAGIAILVTCMGLFGLIAFAAEQRVKEIGIRKVLGATVANIIVLMTKNFVKLVAIAIVVSVPVAWWLMNNWLEGFAYRINLTAWMFMLSAILALAIALITISFQAFRSAVQNPVHSLRVE